MHSHAKQSVSLCCADSISTSPFTGEKTYTPKAAHMWQSQNGNVFFYILLGVALFGALAFSVSRGMRGQTSIALNQRNIDLAVSEILSEAHEIESAINRLLQNSVSESEICFENDLFSTAHNSAYSLISTCSDDTYKLYHRSGGNLVYRNIPEEWLASSHSGDRGYGEWVFTNVNGVQGIGQSTMSEASSMELIAFIPHLKKEVCKTINSQLGVGSIIPDNSNTFTPQPLDSGFVTTSGEINAVDLDSKYSGCFQNSNTWDSYIFYHVLIER